MDRSGSCSDGGPGGDANQRGCCLLEELSSWRRRNSPNSPLVNPSSSSPRWPVLCAIEASWTGSSICITDVSRSRGDTNHQSLTIYLCLKSTDQVIDASASHLPSCVGVYFQDESLVGGSPLPIRSLLLYPPNHSDEKRRPAALNLTPARPSTSESSSSDGSLKPRTPRFAEATSVHSPVDSRSPFADPEKSHAPQPQPADVGFGYIGNNSNRESIPVPMTPKTPLKSAMKVPGTPAGARNPLSPTFREADILEKQELATEKEQARDVKIKARVRMAKFALRGVNFSCSLIILCMLSATFSIFNATRALPDQSRMPSWAKNTNAWPQKLVLAMACVSLAACIIVFASYCRGGHRRAEKVGTYYTLFAIGWFILSLILWVVTAILFQNAKNNSNNKDMWGWSCVQNTRSEVFGDKVDYALICRLQNWAMICIIIEVVIEVLCILLYSIVFYRYYTKRRLFKSMDMRDRARSDLYLAQLRSQSAPNTPGFAPKSPALSAYAMSPRHPPAAYQSFPAVHEVNENPFTPGTQFAEPKSQFAPQETGFKLQAPPTKAPSATPKMSQGGFTPAPMPAPAPPATPTLHVSEHGPTATNEPTYEAVPIPGAYGGQVYGDQSLRSPPPTQTTFGHAQ